VAHYDAGANDGGVHLITHLLCEEEGEDRLARILDAA